MKHAQQREVKHRPWVKNAAIIFLSVMLVLTFFSKTIMNFSLPEVTGQYVSSGVITSSVSGTGTLAANMAYDVQLDAARTIRTVEVAAGDTVTAGQVLFTLEETESEELKTAEAELEQMEYDYGLALIKAVDPDYASENSQLAGISAQLAAAIEARDKAAGQEEAYNNAYAAMTAAQQTVNTLQNEIADMEGQLSLSGSGDALLLQLQAELTAAQQAQAAADAELAAREAELSAAKSQMGPSSAEALATLNDAQRQLTEAQSALAAGDPADPSYAELQQTVDDRQADLDAAQSAYDLALTAEADLVELTAQRDLASGSAENARAAVEAAQSAVDARAASLSDTDLARRLAEKKAALGSAQARLSEAQANLSNTERGVGYDAASDTVRSLQAQLSTAAAQLAEQQRADGVLAEAAQYDLQVQADRIEEKKTLVEQLKNDGSGNDVTTQYGGTVASVNAVAGDVVGPGTSLAAIHVEGKEYTLSFSVPEEQSRLVHVGDQAQVTTFHYGDIRASLAAIRNDPAAPGKNKLLEFTVGGDVTDGQELSLSIGLGDKSYPMVVPKSAIRTDSNGQFILTATTKSSPLGSRYIAKRVPVTVLGSDAYNAAIETADGFTNYYVITTASAPLSDGEQVRLSQ